MRVTYPPPPVLYRAQVGGEEILLEDSRTAAEAATAAGMSVEYREFEGGFRGFHLLHTVLNTIPEATLAVTEVDEYVRKHAK